MRNSTLYLIEYEGKSRWHLWGVRFSEELAEEEREGAAQMYDNTRIIVYDRRSGRKLK